MSAVLFRNAGNAEGRETSAAATPSPSRAGWRPVVSAMAQAGGGSIASGLLSALATKTIATLLGPASLALLQTLQQVRQTAVTAATGNGQTALVQGTAALRGPERGDFLKTTAAIFACGTVLCSAILVFAPGRVAAFAGMPVQWAGLVPWLALPVALSSVCVFLSGLTNALGGVGRLAILQILTSLAMAVGAWPAIVWVRSGHPVALVYLLAGVAAVSAAASLAMLAPDRRRIAEWLGKSGAGRPRNSLRHFADVAGVMFVTGLASSVVLMLVRARILRSEGAAATGQFDAAWNISMNQVTLVLASLQTFYLPTFAGATHREERAALTSDVLTVATLAAAGVIVALASLKPLVLTVLYSAQFHPAAAYLRWTLIGDYLKITSWILTIPMIASADMRVFLASDLAVYGIFALGAIGLGSWFSAAESAALAFVLMYAAHLVLGVTYLRFRHGFFPLRRAILCWLGGFAAVLGTSALTWTWGL